MAVQDAWSSAPPALPEPQLDRYLAHLGLPKPSAPSAEAIAALAGAHRLAIAFENLSPMLGEPVPLDPAALTAKLVDGRRGGYCFEHNLLFGGAAIALGYQVELLAGRVLVGIDPHELRPRTHLVLRVWAPGVEAQLVDVGFGRASLRDPLQPLTGIEQAQGDDRFRFSDHHGEWLLEQRLGEQWQALYLLDLRPVYLQDIEVANHFVATHPNSHMRRTLLLQRPTPGGKLSMQGDQLTIVEAGGPPRRSTVAPEELGGVLRDAFGIELPHDPAPLLR